MKARCVTCEQIVERDEELCWLTYESEWSCSCPGGRACKGDDLRADDAYNDPRTGQAAAINAANRSKR